MNRPFSTPEVLSGLRREMTVVEAIQTMESAIPALRRQRILRQSDEMVEMLTIILNQVTAARDAAQTMKGDLQ